MQDAVGILVSIMARAHGTRASYSAGCRCQRCRTAWADYIRTRRHRLAPPQGEHVREVKVLRGQIDRAIAADRADVEVPVTRVSPLAAAILARVQEETGMRRADVLEDLLRGYGSAVAG